MAMTATKQRQLPPALPIEYRFPIVTTLPNHRVRQYRKRVERGARDLDERQPGWWRHVRVSRLNMALGSFIHGDCGCVGAQLSWFYDPEESFNGLRLGAWDRWMERLGFWGNTTKRMEVAHGYVVAESESHDGETEGRAYGLLDQLWANEVRVRREA